MTLLGLFVSPPATATDGTQLIGIGALQKGTGGAGVASPKDMTWVLLNPASIIDLGCRLDVNLELFAPYRTLQPKGLMGHTRAGEMEDDSYFFIPSVGYSRACECGDEAWGIGLYGVSGMGVEYPRARSILPPLFGRNYDRKTEYSVAKFAVAYAHTIGNSDWTVGIAPHFDFAMFRTDMLTLRFTEAQKNNGWDTSVGVGFSLGLYRHWQRLGLGMAYTSRQWMTEFKDYNDLFFESMDMPQQVQAGVAFDVSPNLELQLDYKYINWAGVDQMAAQPLKGGFGWKDQHIIKSGATWFISPEWTLRGGVSIGNSPIEEDTCSRILSFPPSQKSTFPWALPTRRMRIANSTSPICMPSTTPCATMAMVTCSP